MKWLIPIISILLLPMMVLCWWLSENFSGRLDPWLCELGARVTTPGRIAVALPHGNIHARYSNWAYHCIVQAGFSALFYSIPLGFMVKRASPPTWWTRPLFHRGARPGHCAKCGYDLSATPAACKCPECGTDAQETPPRSG